MKSQNDMIISAVAVVLAIIFLCVFIFTQKEPVRPPIPEQVLLTEPNFQPGAVVMADKLPGGSANQGQQAGGRAPGGGGGGLSRGGPGAGGPAPGGSQFTVGVSGAVGGN